MLKKSPFKTFRWKYWFFPWQQVDWFLFLLPVGLTIFGGLMIYSTELHQQTTITWFLQVAKTRWFLHWFIGVIGVISALWIARKRYEYLLQWHWIIYTITNVSLVAVILFGHSAKGAQRWISITDSIKLQPSEFAKVALIITLASLLHKRTASSIPSLFRALAIVALPWLLIFVQPDLATSLVFGAIALGMLYWANANPGWLLLMVSPIFAAILFSIPWPFPIVLFKELSFGPLGLAWSVAMGIVGFLTLPWRKFAIGTIGALGLNLLGGELGVFAWNHVLKDYQKDRLTVFMNPEHDPLGAGYHLIQSRTAIGAGQGWGKGLFNGSMTQLNFVPEQHTDFIFSAVGEEWGFVGCIVVLIVFWLFCLRLVLIAQNAKDNFGSLLAIGVLSMIIFQVIVNIGMTIGLAPVAGIPLPWMSYGNSAMLTNFIALGMVESVANFRQRQKY